MEKKSIRYIATICFAAIAAWEIWSLISGYLSYPDDMPFRYWFIPIGFVLAVIALLTKLPILSAIGFALITANELIYLIGSLDVLSYWDFYDYLLTGFYLISTVVLLLASIAPKSAKTFGIVSAAAEIAYIIVLTVCYISYDYTITASIFSYSILFAPGAFFFGLTYDGFAKNAQACKVAATNGVPSMQGALEPNNMDKLLRLKAFLDEGVITQEEFDAKKKQLLDL